MSNIQNIQKFADAFKALSNPNRLKIYIRLLTQCCIQGICESEAESCVGDLSCDLEIVPSTVSHHIKELHRAGLIQLERDGQKIVCCTDQDFLNQLREFFVKPPELKSES